jgi:hypothetical protein
MNEKFSKLRQEQKQEIEHQQQKQEEISSAQDFKSVEEMLQADAAQTDVPGRIAEKLNRSIAQEPAPGKSWWRRLFGK